MSNSFWVDNKCQPNACKIIEETELQEGEGGGGGVNVNLNAQKHSNGIQT